MIKILASLPCDAGEMGLLWFDVAEALFQDQLLVFLSQENEHGFLQDFLCLSRVDEEPSHTHQDLCTNLLLQARMNLTGCRP